MLKFIPALSRCLLFILVMTGNRISATAQNNSPPRYAKLVPDGSGGFKTIYFVDTSSTVTRLNKKLDTVSAAFYPISDSILTFPDSDFPGRYFYGSLRNSFSEMHQLSMSYFIRPNHFTGSTLNPILNETKQLLSFIDPTDAGKRDSIVDSEYKRYIAFMLKKNALSNGDSCFSKKEAMIPFNYDKAVLNADSVIILQSVSPPYGTCAVGLSKDVVLYKKGLGYIILGYSLVTDWNRQISFREASDLLDELIRQTWGIIRFNKEMSAVHNH